MKRIDTITLAGVLPKVFAGEHIPPSDVWLADVTLQRGTHYLVTARSGGGKSSLCAYLYGARTDYEGGLLFDGQDTSRLDMAQWQEIRRRHLAYLPQELGLFEELTPMQNIELKNSLTHHVDKGRIVEWLGMLGIDPRCDRPVGRMSVGQRQRVAVVRTLCQPFDFILLDEPVSHLDSANNGLVAQLVAEEANRQGAGIIVTSVGNHLSLGSPAVLAL